MDINTCIATTQDYHTIAYYSHLVPICIALLLGTFSLFATKFSTISRIFAGFIIMFSLWLLGSLIIWTTSNYHLVTFLWATLDYINVVFYLLGAYFFAYLDKDGVVPKWQTLSLFALTIPAWWITVTGGSIAGFNQPVCEAYNNEWLSAYKLAIEWFVSIYIILTTFRSFRKSEKNKRRQTVVVSIGLLLFFVVFSVTEYVSSLTGYYEMNLYSLFILPVFLALIIYSITNLKMFHLRLLGTQLLVYVLLIMIGSQFFFLENATNQILTVITFILSIFFGITLLRNVKREVNDRLEIEKLAGDLQKANTRLKELDKQKTEFISFASHQLRSPLTAIKGYTSLILEGDYGQLSDKLKDAIQVISQSIRTQITVVEDYLNVSRMELGSMKYNLVRMDLKDMVNEVVGEQKTNIEMKKLRYSVELDESKSYPIAVDPDKFKQVIMNTIDNSIKYTNEGEIKISLSRNEERQAFIVRVADSGVGINPAVMPKLFQKFSRAPHASEANIHGTGLGLYIAKEIMNAHKGRIWAESEGEGKGSQFYIEVPEAK